MAAVAPTRPLPWRRVRFLLAPVNAAELLDALAALPGVRRLAAPGDGIAASVMLNGIEV